MLPLALADGDAAAAALKQTPSCVIAKITGARKGAHRRRSRPTMAPAICLCAAIEGGREPDHQTRQRARRAGARGGSSGLMTRLKLLRRIEPAPNPELEIGRFLTSRGFPAHAAAGRRARVSASGSRARHARRPAGPVKHQGTRLGLRDRGSPPLLRARGGARQAHGLAGRAGGAGRAGRAGWRRRRSSPRSSNGSCRARRCSASGPRNCTPR